MPVESKCIRDLLANGVHFGHQTNKWNPKMEKFIFGEKSGIYIIDLEKTEKYLNEAIEFLSDLTASGKSALFVGTKKQAKQIIREEAERCGMFFVDERWLGGCLTNFTTIRKSVDKLNQIQEMKESEVYGTLAKKEKARIDRVEYKLLKNLGGIREMKELPQCVIVIDAEAEDIAIKEAQKIGIPVIALLDTNCDPTGIEFPIPGNDDAIRSIQYIVKVLADAAEKGSKGPGSEVKQPEKQEAEPAEEETEPAEEVAAEEEAPETPQEETVAPQDDTDISDDTTKETVLGEVAEGDIKLDDSEDEK